MLSKAWEPSLLFKIYHCTIRDAHFMAQKWQGEPQASAFQPPLCYLSAGRYLASGGVAVPQFPQHNSDLPSSLLPELGMEKAV